MARDITIETCLPDRPDVVWRALTDPEALNEWLMPVVGFAPVVGCRFQLTAKPMPGWDGVVHCEVLEVDEGRLLSYSWQGTRMKRSTTVTWTLTATDDGGTRLCLNHSGFAGVGGAILRVMHRSGWRKFVLRQLPGQLVNQGNRDRTSGSDRTQE
ncbi:SRPBCC domain-containing protein [Kibdelosporangium lantanae]|uniref:SRPBCC domain-containing protein n=1 Tax=Kibdelosporangium lantanae TaxID=1497396 RepID=A0ABW3M3R3_9PSEU